MSWNFLPSSLTLQAYKQESLNIARTFTRVKCFWPGNWTLADCGTFQYPYQAAGSIFPNINALVYLHPI
jgi:hypothetical protein